MYTLSIKGKIISIFPSLEVNVPVIYLNTFSRARILAIHLMEPIQKDPDYAQALGIEAGMKKQLACSINAYLHAEGLTDS